MAPVNAFPGACDTYEKGFRDQGQLTRLSQADTEVSSMSLCEREQRISGF